jgi:two-component system chemotaxis response regulator CheB
MVVGASAGGVEALTQLVAALPADFPASLFIVLHVSPHSATVLPQILSRRGALPALHPRDKEPIRTGTIYVAPPDRHLVLRRGHVRLTRGPSENGHRPAVDPLFRTAARSYGSRVVGVVLSGSLDDGTAGLLAIKERGGLAIVQSPDEALYPGMPRSALELVDVDYCVTIAEMAPLLVRLAVESTKGRGDPAASPDLEIEARIAEFDLTAMEDETSRPGTPSGFGCPACGGALWELEEGGLVRFRCRVGHAWSAVSLLAEQSERLDEALWNALRALEEKAGLANLLAGRMQRLGSDRSAASFRKRADQARSQADVIRRALLERDAEHETSTELLDPGEGDAE